MKTNLILKSILAAAVLSVASPLLIAQSTTGTCPLGHTPGYGRTLTPEQRAAQRAVMQEYVAELQKKQANGTLTVEEQAWLKKAEERGGACVGGTAHRAGAGKGKGAGKGQRRGACDGTGPLHQGGICPNGNTPAQQGAAQ